MTDKPCLTTQNDNSAKCGGCEDRQHEAGKCRREEREGMQLSDLRPVKGANKDRKRVGRGHGSGHVKTAGKGMKGQKARSGGNLPPRFMGGQTPIQQQLPYKRGFTN